MSIDGQAAIAAFAEEALGIDLMPWQVQALNVVLTSKYESSWIAHPRRAGRATGIRQMNIVLDELWERATWMLPDVELAVVYQVAAKHLPEPARHADLRQMQRVLDLVV